MVATQTRPTTLPARYGAALDMQARIAQWLKTDAGQVRIGTLTQHLMNASRPIGEPEPLDALGVRQLANQRMVIRRSIDSILCAPPYFVASDIVDVINAATPGLPPWTSTPTLRPTPSGFVMLEKAVPLTASSCDEFCPPERHPHSGYLRAFGWLPSTRHERKPGQPRVWIDRTDAPGIDNAMSLHFFISTTPESVPQPSGISLLIDGRTPYSESWETCDGKGGNCGHDHGYQNCDNWQASTADLNRKIAFVGVFLLFIRQKIAYAVDAPADRAVRRRNAEHFEHAVPPVRVIRLRERKIDLRPVGESQPVDWSCRWVVGADDGGFWRQQWYPKEQAHYPRWIFPYIKGPASKPLRGSSGRAFVVDR